MLQIDKTQLKLKPFPHLVQKELFKPDFYDALKSSYPAFGKADEWSRMSRDLMRGDPLFEATISKTGPWNKLFQYFNSAAYLDDMLDLFGEHMLSSGLTVNPSELKIDTDYVETREWIATNKPISKTIQDYQGPREELFVRMDMGVGANDYYRPPHLDWRHRVCSLLVYFDDPQETHMEGGKFIINEQDSNTGKFSDVSTIEPENNMGIFKLDSNTSWHSVTKITNIDGERRTLYVPLSSRGNIWPVPKAEI